MIRSPFLVAFMKVLVDLCCQLAADSRNLLQLLYTGLADLLYRAEVLDQILFALGANTWNLVQDQPRTDLPRKLRW